MKKIIAVIFLSVAMNAVNAQQQVSVGLDVAIPLADLSTTQGIGIGATAKLHYPIQNSLQLTATTGYMSFAGKTVDGYKYGSFGVLPLKVGLRFSVAENVFIEPEVGLWFGNRGWGTSFAYGGGIYKSWNNFDIGARIEGSSKNSSNAWFIGLRAAYKFDLAPSAKK